MGVTKMGVVGIKVLYVPLQFQTCSFAYDLFSFSFADAAMLAIVSQLSGTLAVTMFALLTLPVILRGHPHISL